MPASAPDSTWFGPAAPWTAEIHTDDTREFSRIWQGFMTARFTLGLVLLAMQVTMLAIGTSHSKWLVVLCLAYFGSTLTTGLFGKPLFLGNSFNRHWIRLVGLDVLAFSSLQILQGNAVNYTPLFALPILLASVLGSLRLALGTAAGVTVLMAPWGWAAGSGQAIGYGMLLLCSLMWSLAIIVTRRFPPAASVLELLPWCFGLAALLLAPIALWREPLGGIGPDAWWQAVFVGAVAGPLGTWSTIEAGRRLPGAVVSLGFLMVPAIGVVVSSLWLGETLGWDVLLGGGLIAVSVAVAVRG